MCHIKAEEKDVRGDNSCDTMKQQKLSGYLVFIGAFTTRVLLVVLMQNGGIFLLTFQREFNVGATLAGWLGSLPIATRGFIGLPTGAALRRWSCRKVGIVGAILLPVGILSSIFASTIEHLVVTFAIVTGIGGGILWLTSVVVVEKHFTEHFALAHSMVSSGGNIGKMILPPFIRFLIDTYGWRGALLIEAALLFHCVAAASVFKSQQRTTREMDTKTQTDIKHDSIKQCDTSSTQLNKDKDKMAPMSKFHTHQWTNHYLNPRNSRFT
ncbi:monocarboxylate transporter 13-like [Amphiura filiformis]|uniref:monocarboxylate transporter 13-like n=1 Tax=Amphiura filiformis TaxID=82378 RepID=UPI003B218621